MNTGAHSIGNWIRLGLFAAAFVATVYFAVISDAPLPDHRWIVGYNDLILHAGAFGALSFLILLKNRFQWISVGLLCGMAVAIEVAQIWEPNRNASLGDFASSFAGILIGWLLAKLLNSLLSHVMHKA